MKKKACVRECPICKSREKVIRKGFYERESDRKKIQKYYCKSCDKSFSEQTFSYDYRLRKRHLNQIIFKLLCKSVSQGGIAQILNIKQEMIALRIKRYGLKAREHLEKTRSTEDLSEVEVANFRGERRRLPCPRLVVAAGGLESNRILLWLQERRGFLRGGAQEALGRGFMDHPCLEAGWVETEDAYNFQKTFNTQIRSGRKYSVRLSAPEKWMQEGGRLNVSAGFLMKGKEGTFDPYAEYRNFRSLWRHPGRIGETVSSLAATAGALVRDGFVYKRGLVPTFGVMCEQEALPGSRITLGREKDRFGVPRLSLHWEISPRTWQTVVKFCRLVKGEVERLGYGKVNLRREIMEEIADGRELLTDVNHHMGGTVMGTDPERSVVDENLKVHRIKNLWVASSSVFPSSSHSNPTLTLLALVHRLSEHGLEQANR